MAVGRVFILESPNPLDLIENRGERAALEQVCKLMGYDASTFLLRDVHELEQTFNYISSIKGDKKDKTPLFLHISVHGNNSGIAIGRDNVSWSKLASVTEEMYSELSYYHGPVILILSACGANKQKLTKELMKCLAKSNGIKFTPPEYLFVFNQDDVLWIDAVVTWTIFYRQARNLNFSNKAIVQNLLNKLYQSKFGDIKYYRWDFGTNKYKYYTPKNK